MRADLSSKAFVETLVSTQVSEYTVKNGCAEGDNVAGSLKKLEILKKDGEKLEVIFKIIPEKNPPEFIIPMKIFRREHAVYRTLAPMLRDFSKSRGVEYEPPLPKYFSGFNDDKDDYLCLQDVRPQGYIMPDKRVTLKLNEMSLILRELAKFHAVSYALLQEKGESLFKSEEMSYFQDLSLGQVELPGEFDNLIEKYYKKSTELMESRNPEVGKRMEALIQKGDLWKIRSRTDVNPAYFKTIIHYDLWTNNLLIKYDKETGEPSQVKFIDFQFAQVGNVMSDLQYLIFTSTTPEFRKDNLLTILGVYYDEMSNTLNALKCPHPIGFTRGFLIDEFYKCFLPGFIHMTFAIALQLGDISQLPINKEAARQNGNSEENNQPDPDDVVDLVQQFYLGSPVALQRLDSIAQEMIDYKFL